MILCFCGFVAILRKKVLNYIKKEMEDCDEFEALSQKLPVCKWNLKVAWNLIEPRNSSVSFFSEEKYIFMEEEWLTEG